MAQIISNPVPFEVLTDTTVPYRIGMELEVYGYDDPHQIIDVLPFVTEPVFLDELGVGGGSFNIMADDQKLVDVPTLLDDRNVVKCRLDGQIVNAFVIQSAESDFISPNEKSGEFWTVSGEGLRTWFHDATVQPYGGLKKDSLATRVFSFASEQGHWYNPAAWVTPVNVHQYSGVPDPSNPWGTAPANWPDAPNADWVWGVNNSTASPAPLGINYFRYEFDVTGTTTDSYSVFCAADDDFDIYMDAQQIITSRETAGYAKTWRADFTLAPGHHVLAARVQNNGGPAGLIAALFKAGDAAAGTAATLLTTTGDVGWKVNSYPATAPGWTPGEIMTTLLNEASDRGVRFAQILVPTFTQDADSDGATWTRALDWEFDIGMEYSDVLAKLEELVCEAWIDPSNYQLNMYAERGTHRDVQSPAVQPVKFEVGRNVVKAHEASKSAIKNALTMKSNDGWSNVASADDSITKYGRMEGLVSTGASGAVTGDVANKVFESKSFPETTATYTIIDVDDARPYVDFFAGDWVLAPTTDGSLTPRRVVSISLASDRKTGQPAYALEFDTIFQTRADRLERWLKTTGDGTLGGTLSNVSSGGGSGSGAPSSQTTPSGPQGQQGVPGIPGANWRGVWTGALTYAYRDAVSYNGASWVATVANTGVAPSPSTSQWQLIAAQGSQGLYWRGAWLSSTTYHQFDAVFSNNTSWIATGTNSNSVPSVGNPDWTLLAQGTGPTFRGAWSSSTTYVQNDITYYLGKTWITSVTNSNKEPGTAAEWSLYGGPGTRLTSSYTTPSLSPGSSNVSVIPLGIGYRLYKLVMTKPARVRLYASAAYQSADAPRSIGVDPVGDHGLMFEFVGTSTVLSAVLSPFVDGASFENSSNIPISISNVDTSSGTIQVTLTFMATE